MKKRSQTLSGDVVIAIALFLIGFLMFFHIVNMNTGDDLDDLKREGSLLPLKFTSSREEINPNAFIIENKVSKEKLREVASIEYSQLKQELNLKYDFCLYFEDENGNILNISSDTGRLCIGSPNATLNGVPCG